MDWARVATARQMFRSGRAKKMREKAGLSLRELAAAALKHLKVVRSSTTSNAGRGHLAEAEELIKQLAVGPGEDGDGRIPLKESAGRKPRKRRVASQTFACRVCDEKFMAIREARYCSGACNQQANRERKRESESIR